ncbi:unnamed protein product [Prunus armeniaca]|uniref:Uncharacterized protein n=1 Tax=Prunus armeniaca TaxID=36596 RepID=A0A6J5TXX3_PRUAR|nr:unnamed protein product [Prunus armeniaca]
MEFHPVQHTLLSVCSCQNLFSLILSSCFGTNIACVPICEELVSRSFKVWKLAECSEALKASVTDECTASVNRVIWSPEGSHLDAHVDNVSDLAFTHINKQLCIINCGEDKTIKIWDVASGDELYTFEAPVVCGDIQFQQVRMVLRYWKMTKVFNRYIHLRIMEFLPLGCLLELLGSDQKG